MEILLWCYVPICFIQSKSLDESGVVRWEIEVERKTISTHSSVGKQSFLKLRSDDVKVNFHSSSLVSVERASYREMSE